MSNEYESIKDFRGNSVFTTMMLSPIRILSAILFPGTVILSYYFGAIFAHFFGYTDLYMEYIAIPNKHLLATLADHWWIGAIWAFCGRWIYLLCGDNPITNFVFGWLCRFILLALILGAMMSYVFSLLVMFRIWMKFVDWVMK